MQPARHSLVWLTPHGWDVVQAAGAERLVGQRDAIARWRAADWPLVAARTGADAAPTQIALGMALPPDGETRPRIGFNVGADLVRRLAPAVTLAAALGQAPPHWRTALLALHLEAQETQLQLAVFGSLAWQTLTGMTYLQPRSDIDLLFVPADAVELTAGIALLDRYARVLPLDGEVMFPGGGAVAWKEWRDVAKEASTAEKRAATAGSAQQAASSARVMTKYLDRVALETPAWLLAGFGQARRLP